jgi:hypothetical protein
MDDDDDRTIHLPPAGEPCRNPLDPCPYEDDEDADGPQGLWAADPDDRLAKHRMKHLWDDIEAIVERSLSSHTSVGDTVALVDEHYRTHAGGSAARAWSRKAIYNYVVSTPERQANHAVDVTWKLVEFLRDHVATRQDDQVTPNLGVARMLLTAAKTHQSLADARRKRERG